MTDRKKYLILVALILAALAGVVALAIPSSPAHKKVTLGLDLQGGLEVILQAVPPPGHKLTAEDMTRAISIMRQRIDKLGVSEPEIRKQSSNQIVIELPGIKNADDAQRIIGKTAQLELYDFEADLLPPSVDTQGFPNAEPTLYNLLAAVQAKAKQGTPTQWYLFKNKVVVAGPRATQATKTRKSIYDTDAAKAAKIGPKTKTQPKGYKLFAVPSGTVVISCKAANGCLGVRSTGQPSTTYFYLLKYQPNNKKNPIPEMTGKELKLSGTRADFNSVNQPVVTLQFTSKGAKQFEKITKAEANRGQLRFNLAGGQGDPQNYSQHFAIVLDRELRSAPYIDFKRNPDGIAGSQAEIEMGQGGTLNDAKQLALVLQTGALPVNFVQQSRTDVSATLGKDSLQEAKKAAIGGLIAVAVFLLLLYRFLGLVAVIGLGIYAAFLYAAVLLFGVTMTLPGFAGLILTIGVAADANVVVFERIKEEVRAGKSVRAAISAGYSKGFRTILDANVVTCITALVLFAVATAGVKGFALMLLIGTVISLITAVAATRAMLGLLAGFRWFSNPRFMGAHGAQGLKWLQIDFMRKRYLWFAMSGALVVLCIGSLGLKGLNLGIDFKGGTQITFATSKPHAVEDVRALADHAIIQGRGKQLAGGKFTNFQIRERSLSSEQQAALTKQLREKVDATKLGVQNVSSSFGRQIARDAITAILFSLLLIVIYMAIRFDYKFAVPVIIAMIHDVLIATGIYSLTGREVTTSTVAAILTVLGYSIYDTIIIFDRIRENIPIMRRSSFATITNVSLWETIRRSLATTFITLLPVGALFVFGGATLQDFAFALLVGVASGAYSSIFIAAPLLAIWKEREPDYAKRRGQDDASRDGRGQRVLDEAEAAASATPAPELAPVAAVERVAADIKRERRRQRRRARPHGRAR